MKDNSICCGWAEKWGCIFMELWKCMRRREQEVKVKIQTVNLGAFKERSVGPKRRKWKRSLKVEVWPRNRVFFCMDWSMVIQKREKSEIDGPTADHFSPKNYKSLTTSITCRKVKRIKLRGRALRPRIFKPYSAFGFCCSKSEEGVKCGASLSFQDNDCRTWNPIIFSFATTTKMKRGSVPHSSLDSVN